jgi:hypothetical protein
MSTRENTTSIQTTSRLTGFLYLLLVPLGVFGLLYVPYEGLATRTTDRRAFFSSKGQVRSIP